ncbi:plasmid stabilization protein [Geomonas sp.]|uniref:type II toxin-antitoxin system RelE/ParE family toxin n=1 Tax=Geomonas sp. TaxID=2651584 RepID=UPI002B49C092|nr:plasmid stabilization protein [Geomonas sp.]HJV36908.1 plasmid stabilization protein [Geomonas sp.]
MIYQLVFTDQYMKRARRFLKKHPDLESSYLKTLRLLQANPFHPSLRLHRLSGRLDGLYSVSITLSYRITMEFLVKDDQIVPVDVGDHDTVY